MIGYNVVTACDGTEALELFQNCVPDLVVLDVMMPGVSGLDAIRAIRLFTAAIADAALEGSKLASARREEGAREAARQAANFNAGGRTNEPTVQHVGRDEEAEA